MNLGVLKNSTAYEQGRGVVMITHDTRLLDKVDRVYVMSDGNLVEEKCKQI